MRKLGATAAGRSRAILVAAALLGALAAPFVWRALTHLDSNLFNQASGSLKRFALLREVSENFGGDLLAAVVTIPDAHSADDVVELKRFALLLANEWEELGTSDEERAALTAVIRQRLDALQPVAEGVGHSEEPGGADGPLTPALFPDGREEGEPRRVPWLRNVECRTGQGIERAMKTLLRQRPHVLLTTADVEELRKRFETAALDARMERIAEEAAELAPHSPEKTRLYEDPLGILELGKTALTERLKKRAPPLAKDPEGFFLSPDGTTLVLLARTTLPSNLLDFDRPLMAAVQRAENRAVLAYREQHPKLSTSLKSAVIGQIQQPEYPGQLQAGYTGMSAIYVENELTLKWDLALNTGSSVLGVLLLFLIVYRSAALTWKVTAATLYTIWLTLALAGLWKGSLSLLGGAFTAVPVGLVTDYAILVYNTYQALRAEQQLEPGEAMARALALCGPSIITAALITAIAFFGVGFTQLTGLAELGILGGASALLGCVVMLVVLPAWLCAADGKRANRIFNAAPRPGLSFGMPALGRWLEKKSARRTALVFSALVLLGGIGLIQFGPDPGSDTVAGVRFDPELGNLRSLNSLAIPLRKRIAERFKIGLADISVIVSARDEESAAAILEEVQERLQPFVASGELSYNGSAADLLPAPASQRASIAALKSFDLDDALKRFQTSAQKRFGVKGAAYFNPFLRHLRDLKILLSDPRPLLLDELMKGPLSNVLASSVKLAPGAPFPVLLRSAWLPRDGAMPAAWYGALTAALEDQPYKGGAQVRVTAGKMVGFELKSSTLHDCGWITLIVALCVALSLAAALRSLKNCLLALVPLLFAYLAMLAGVPLSQLLGWDYSLNFVNLIMFPLLLGSAVDYGVYMVFGYCVTPRPRMGALMSSTGRSVLYCIATTLIGFGSFVTSSYTGLLSMGVASMWGYAGAAFGALFVLPALMGNGARDLPAD